jgi:valyl-tRNA synthetase
MLEKFDKKKEQEIFEKIKWRKLEKRKKIFAIDTPPPYPSGRPWHIGAAVAYSQMDMIARTARALGFNVYFPIGIDRNGLPVEMYTEKKYNVSMHQLPREKFVELCKEALDELEAEMIGIMKAMGMSCDFENYYRTDSPSYRAFTQSTFIELWNNGLIYEAERPNNFCTGCKTTIADAEIAYREEATELYYIKFKLKEGKEEGKRGEEENLIIATTRPEFLGSCQAVIVNPNDERYKQYVGKKVIVPIYNKEVGIVAHPYAKPEFGSGAVMICSYGDQSDVQLFRELKLKEIKLLDVVDNKVVFNKNAGLLEGLGVIEGRKKIAERLEQEGLIVKKEVIQHKIPICERCKSRIEIIPMKEFYLKQLEFKQKMLEFAKRLKFFPEWHRQRLLDWINAISQDWPISRRRYYGTEIPIWYCKKCGKPNLPKADYKSYYRPWLEKPPFKKCKYCGFDEFVGEERTLDTWMDSGISPLFITRYKKDEKFFKAAYPVALRPQGYEIIRTWLYYSMLRCYQLTKKLCFKYAWIHGLGVDERGRKMSKSLGNVIDPFPILKEKFADAVRLAGVLASNQGHDFRIGVERIEDEEKFLNKLFNIANFISNFEFTNKKPKLKETDKAIIEKWNKVKEEVIHSYKEFNFHISARLLKDFTWNYFASHYIELVKPRAYARDKSAKYTLNKIFREILIFFHPIIPFITYYIFDKLYKEEICSLKFPKKEKIKAKISFDDIVLVNQKIWKYKKERGLSLKSSLECFDIEKKFKVIEEDIKRCHGIKKINFV